MQQRGRRGALGTDAAQPGIQQQVDSVQGVQRPVVRRARGPAGAPEVDTNRRFWSMKVTVLTAARW